MVSSLFSLLSLPALLDLPGVPKRLALFWLLGDMNCGAWLNGFVCSCAVSVDPAVFRSCSLTLTILLTIFDILSPLSVVEALLTTLFSSMSLICVL